MRSEEGSGKEGRRVADGLLERDLNDFASAYSWWRRMRCCIFAEAAIFECWWQPRGQIYGNSNHSWRI